MLEPTDTPGRFSGYASVFDVVDRDRDVVVPGAFRRGLKENRSYALLWQHKTDQPIGVIHQLREDSHGLWIDGQLMLEVERAREAYALLKAGALGGLSIGYVTRDYAFDQKTGHRLLTDVDLWEVSLVTFPANPQAQVRSLKGLV